MGIISRFAGLIDAAAYAYGIVPDAPAPLQVISGSTTSGTFTLTCQPQKTPNPNGVNCAVTTNTPILVGNGTNYETVTPSGVSYDGLGNVLITATFANAHSTGEQVRSGTVGLQEALNYAAGVGGGAIVLTTGWATYGGTTAMLTSSVVADTVSIIDNRYGAFDVAGNVPSSVTPLAAPTAVSTAAATNGLLTTATTGGTIPATSTYRVGITYVDAFGGETLLSTDTASTSTIETGAGSTNSLGLTSPAAETGAVGYRVYVSAANGASLSEILYPVGNSAITGTPVSLTAGSPILPCFQIGTPVTITAIITGTAKVPSQPNAFTYGTAEVLRPPLVSYPPFQALGTIAAAATGTLGQITFPAGFFNTIGRTVRVRGAYYVTTNGTAGTVTTELILASIFGVTSITPFTAASASFAASDITANFLFDVLLVTAATGATGNLEVHGTVTYNIAGTAVGSVAQDSIQAVSSNLDLTKSNTLSVAHLNTTLGTSASQLRQLTIEVMQ
jgi:hypothetical protein